MQDSKELIKMKLDDLIENGSNIFNHFMAMGIDCDEDHQMFTFAYQDWYTGAVAVVKQLIPERIDEFTKLNKAEGRSSIRRSNYTISDYLQHVPTEDDEKCFPVDQVFQMQFAILKSARARIDNVLSDITGVLRSEIFDSELKTARILLEAGLLRPAGVITGVTLESHLKAICELHEISISKKKATLSDYNDELKKENVFDLATWRWLQRLGDIRNYCCHKKEREPTYDELDEFISGVEKIIKTLF